MGREAKVGAEFDGWTGTGKLLLETDDLIFRGEKRLVVPRKAISKATADDAWLDIRWKGGRARFEVGATAARWANDILHPKSLIDKLDVKPDSRAAIVAIRDTAFRDDVAARALKLDARIGAGPYDLIFFGAAKPPDFDRLADLRTRLVPAGAVWIITPKGVREMGHEPIVRAAKAAGLVDVKTARFSETHTALKLVIPKADR
jgi:Protein of unknown function (DUF3052)